MTQQKVELRIHRSILGRHIYVDLGPATRVVVTLEDWSKAIGKPGEAVEATVEVGK